VLFDPWQSRDGVDAYRFEAHAVWCGDADRAGWWVDAEVNVFDVFAHDIDADAAKLHRRDGRGVRDGRGRVHWVRFSSHVVAARSKTSVQLRSRYRAHHTSRP
jgi:hypothetical protein